MLWFTKELFLISQIFTLSKELFQNLPLKSIRIFSSVPTSEEAPKLFHKFRKVNIKIFNQYFVVRK